MENENNNENDVYDIEPDDTPVLAMEKPRKSGRISRLDQLTDDEYNKMLQYVRAGAYEHVAAGVLGVTKDTFDRWKRKGRTQKGGSYQRFYMDLVKAQTQARLLAEVEIKKDDPKFWLTHGPGKYDWSERKEVVMENIEVEPRAEREARRLSALADMAKAWDELGLLQLTEEGRKMFMIEVDSESVDDDDANPIEEDYMPEPGSNGNGKPH